MEKFTIDPRQVAELEKAFRIQPMVDGWQAKFEFINEKFFQLARQMYTVTKDSHEQREGLKKLQEAQAWFEQAVKKNEF